MSIMDYKYLEKFILERQTRGYLTFTLDQFRNWAKRSEEAVKFALIRGVKARKIYQVRKGFYVIIPPEYYHGGFVPPVQFIDDLFSYLDRKYYVSLLSAAALHGAAHQKSFTFFVFNEKPAIRNIDNDKMRVHFYVKNRISDIGVQQRNTQTGIIRFSSTELTACDLVQYQSRCGGLNLVTTILDELEEEVHINRFHFKEWLIFSSTIQRLGYIMDRILNRRKISDFLYKELKKIQNLNRVPLKAGKEFHKNQLDNKWNVYANIELESDL